MITLQPITGGGSCPSPRCLFLADVHLRDRRDPHYEIILDFLRHLSGPGSESEEIKKVATPGCLVIDHLFILGDFFDFWFSRAGRIYPGFQDIVERLRRLKEEGINVHLCEGNHDFFMKAYFSRLLGMEVCEDWAEVSLEGRRLLIGHGDLVDVSNHYYLWLRKILRSRAFYFLQMILPLPLLWEAARKSSQTSQEYMGGAQEAIALKMETFARDKFQEGYEAVILGHCHKAQHQDIVTETGMKTFVTLGDWVSQYTFLYYTDRRFQLCRYAGAGEGIKLDIV